MKAYKITNGGQVSLPVGIRRRWGVSRVLIEDLGDRVTVRPVPDDPITAFRGAFAGGSFPDSAELRKRAREDESRAESRRASA